MTSDHLRRRYRELCSADLQVWRRVSQGLATGDLGLSIDDKGVLSLIVFTSEAEELLRESERIDQEIQQLEILVGDEPEPGTLVDGDWIVRIER